MIGIEGERPRLHGVIHQPVEHPDSTDAGIVRNADATDVVVRLSCDFTGAARPVLVVAVVLRRRVGVVAVDVSGGVGVVVARQVGVVGLDPVVEDGHHDALAGDASSPRRLHVHVAGVDCAMVQVPLLLEQRIGHAGGLVLGHVPLDPPPLRLLLEPLDFGIVVEPADVLAALLRRPLPQPRLLQQVVVLERADLADVDEAVPGRHLVRLPRAALDVHRELVVEDHRLGRPGQQQENEQEPHIFEVAAMSGIDNWPSRRSLTRSRDSTLHAWPAFTSWFMGGQRANAEPPPPN